MSETFKALVLEEEEDGKTINSFKQLTIDDLPDGDVVVAVSHSSLNYKDGLAITGTGKIIRKFPFVPGIDLAGVVESSQDEQYKAGDKVLLTGWGVGERHWGGFAQKARLKAKWLTPLPQDLTPTRAMAIGTAGFTAMLSVMALEDNGIQKDAGPVLVTGANGGVGSVAVSLLSALGYEVTASTGRLEESDFLKELGATNILPREELSRKSKPLEKETWNGAIDTVGGEPLATILSQLRYNSVVAACGLAAGVPLPTTVFPFILRNISLQGIDSVMCPPKRRQQAWQRLTDILPMDRLDALTTTIPFADLPQAASTILAGGIRGRTVIDVNS
ncbi:MAG: oxidoreductase [Magnetococcales bacterium]|nr:oxidoreductase [Magnetococcales bacterium]